MALQDPAQTKLLSKRKSTDLSGIKAALEADGYGVDLEYRFHPLRKWRFDLLVWRLNLPVAVLEVDGGCFIGGGHVRGGYLRKQNEKQNEAVLMGYRIFRCFPEDVRNGNALALIRRALEQRV